MITGFKTKNSKATVADVDRGNELKQFFSRYHTAQLVQPHPPGGISLNQQLHLHTMCISTTTPTSTNTRNRHAHYHCRRGVDGTTQTVAGPDSVCSNFLKDNGFQLCELFQKTSNLSLPLERLPVPGVGGPAELNNRPVGLAS